MTQPFEIHTRDEDTATVNGKLIHRGGFATIYNAAIGVIMTHAQDQGRPVLVKAIDGVNADAISWITVAGDGTVAETTAPTSDQPSPTRGRRYRTDDSPGIDENEFYPTTHSPAAAPVAAAAIDPVEARGADAPIDPAPSDPAPQEQQRPDSSQPATAGADSPTYTYTPQPVETRHTEADPATGPAPLEPQRMSTPPAYQPSPDSYTPYSEPEQPEPRTGPIPTVDRAQQFLPPPPREPYAQHQQGPTWPPAHPQQQPSQGVHLQAPQHAAPWVPQQPMAPQSPPSLADLRASRPDAPESPATTGWRGGFNRATGGLFKLSPSEDELRLRRARDAVQRSLRGPRTVVVINTKGGGGKTTAVYSLAATFGEARGGYVLGWDNNETRGTLAWRSAPARHTNTAVDLLRDLERFEDPRNARVGDLDNYVRAQGSAQFDVLASDENAASAASIDDAAFRALHRSLSRFYRILVIDTGNNVKAPNWGAAVDLADQLVIVSSVREDTAGGASWTLDHLTEIGLGDKVRNAVTILSAPKAAADPDQRAMQARFRQHFAARTRTVLDVPFDPALVDGDSIVFEALSPATRQAWLIAAAAIAEGL